ncbi:DUF4145 domain-containing protein [Vulcanisaeta sp. JCM 14467]|uniref:DUF4145 domain-containing protein n=1 Tax=Vulcanisaeta sp. JCM 14467 TaxID=1295370 RepID=UPI0006D00287|nr:DUF4145 domain-containing protein [Vulcanisaeta sp. JCM 14467]
MRCGVPFCPREAGGVVRIRYVVGEPEVALCSEHASRFRKAEYYWGLINWDSLGRAYLLFGLAHQLLGNAVLLFAMGFNDASAIMVRASLETMLHSVLSMSNPKFSNDGMLITYEHDKTYDECTLGQLISEAGRKGLLNGDLIGCANRIKEYGNFVTHIGERQWRQLIRAINSDELKLWIGDNDIEEALRCIIEIMNHLASNLTRK